MVWDQLSQIKLSNLTKSMFYLLLGGGRVEIHLYKKAPMSWYLILFLLSLYVLDTLFPPRNPVSSKHPVSSKSPVSSKNPVSSKSPVSCNIPVSCSSRYTTCNEWNDHPWNIMGVIFGCPKFAKVLFQLD